MHVYSGDSTDLLSLIGTIDSNYYFRPLANTNFMHRQGARGGAADITFDGWKSTLGYDRHSSIAPFTYLSPAVQDTSVKVVFNATAYPKKIELSTTYLDVFGGTREQSITLPPFSATLLFIRNNFIRIRQDMGNL